MKRILILSILTAFSLIVPGYAEATLSPEDFAYGLPIQIREGSAIYEVPLPIEFYQGVVKSDLGDVRVFNGRGEVVPHAIKQSKREDQAAPDFRGLPFFPLPGAPGQGFEGLSVTVQRNDKGSLVRLYSSDTTPPERTTAAYFVDASQLKKPLKALELQWAPTAEGFLGKVRVEGSNDLERWSSLASGAVIAGLRHGGHSLSQGRISFSPATLKYIRISWPPELQEVKLRTVTGEMVEEEAEQPRQWTRVQAIEVKDRPGEYRFTLPGPIPADRLRVRLPQKNTLVSASIFSRDDEKNPWKSRVDNLQIYRLTWMDEELASPDFSAPRSTDRHWLLRVGQGGGGLGQGLPEFEIGWIPQVFLFTARGDGPFILAFGNGGQALQPLAGGDLLVGFTDEKTGKISAQPASTLPRVVLGGESRLRPSSIAAWRKWFLWGSLILAVALLGWMALRLVKQFNRQDTGPS